MLFLMSMTIIVTIIPQVIIVNGDDYDRKKKIQ